jgi:hypothetical protein
VTSELLQNHLDFLGSIVQRIFNAFLLDDGGLERRLEDVRNLGVERTFRPGFDILGKLRSCFKNSDYAILLNRMLIMAI